MASRPRQSQAIQAAAPRDWDAAEKLDALMRNLGLTPALLAVDTGVSAKWIKEIVANGRQPGTRIRHALARRFSLMPADLWRCDRLGLSPQDLAHLRLLAEKEEHERRSRLERVAA